MISVIVPVFNVDQYLDKCIESIVKQTYQNIEIILVNDGSSDNSYNICYQWSQTYSNIIIINKENGGLSSARNAGLDVAQGDYIAFVDSDDYIEKDMLATMRAVFDKNSCVSVVVCSTETFDEYNRTKQFMSLSSYGYMKSKDYLRLILKRKANNAVWNKLYRKESINKLRFIDGRINEDILFNTSFLLQSEGVYSIPKVFYKYRLRQGSITQQANPKLFQFIENAFIIRNDITNIYGDELKHEINGYTYHEICNFISTIQRYNSYQSFSKEIDFCLDYLKQNWQDFITNPNCSLIYKFKIFFVLIFPKVYRFLLKLK